MNTQIIEFYAKLLQLRLLCREAAQLGEHLQVPDNALIGGMDYLDGRITEHLSAAQWSIKQTGEQSDDVPLYRVKLLENHSAKPDQIVDGYLSALGDEITTYPRGEAIKKARLFGGKIEFATENL